MAAVEIVRPVPGPTRRGQPGEAWNLLQARFSAGVESAGYGPGAIYDAVFEANDMQRTFNRNAEEAGNPEGPN